MHIILVCFRFSLPVSLVHYIWDFCVSNLIITHIIYFDFCMTLFQIHVSHWERFSVGFIYLILHVSVAKTWTSEYISNTKEARCIFIVPRLSVHSLMRSIASMLPSSSGTLWFLPKSKLPAAAVQFFYV